MQQQTNCPLELVVEGERKCFLDLHKCPFTEADKSYCLIRDYQIKRLKLKEPTGMFYK